MIDHRRNYVLMLDTETANTMDEIIPATFDEEGNELTPEKTVRDMSNVLFYDCGWAVIDTKGNIYETASYVNKDIFIKDSDLMKSAYYAKKIPQYLADLENGSRKLATTYEIRNKMLEVIEEYGIKFVCAHNSRFDYNALNTTRRYVTASKYRYWFPFDKVEIWDTMKMAQDVVCQMPTYKEFCKANGYTLPNGAPRKTAEILYRFISGDNDFEESHTGLEDVLIEAQIMWYCMRQHKPMRKKLFENELAKHENTPFQINLSVNLKDNPTIRVGRA